MQQIKILVLCCLVLALSNQAKTQHYSTVKIFPTGSKTQMAKLLGLLEIDHFDTRGGGLIAEIDQQKLDLLRRSGFRYEVLVENTSAEINKLNKAWFSAGENKIAFEQPGGLVNTLIPTPAAFQVQASLGGYYSFAQMNTAMDNLVAAYPAIAQKTSLGLSVEGRNIWCIKISDNVATDEPDEPEVLYIGLQHAREAIGGSSMIFFMQYLCENYATDPRIQSLVNNREIFIIPCMNPDGWEYNRATNPGGGGGWRKNRRNNGDGTYGVDLNRNWGIDWGNCSGASSSCGSGNTSSDTYWGLAAFSEPETNAVRNFVLSHHLVACIDQHAYGPYYSLPFGRPSLHTGSDSLTVPQQQYYTFLSAAMGKYNGMRAGNSIQSVGYEVAGGVKDWMLKGEIGSGSKDIVLGLTGEGGAGGGTGGTYGSFWPPASEIIKLCKGMVFQNIQLALSAGSYADITDRSDIEVSAASGSFNFRVKRTGLENNTVTVSLVPVENISTAGADVTINSLTNYFDIYAGAIPYTLSSGIKNGDRIRFIWRVQTGGQVIDDTVTKFYNPVVLFFDNMDGASVTTNWIVSGNWNYTATQSYSGLKSLSESPSGNYGANRNDVIRYNGTFDLGDATAAYLQFWVRHRAENFRDKLQVQVSVNGTTWVSLRGLTTVEEPGTLDGNTLNGEPSLTGIREDWTPELFNLSAFIGQPALRLRLVFTSDANTTGYDFQVDDGFNIDDLKLVKAVNSLPPLPLTYINLVGKLRTDHMVELKWQAETGQSKNRFIIERSANGISYSEIGASENRNVYIDHFPVAGNNYYRIWSVLNNGDTIYSQVVNVIWKPESNITIYPNPVFEELNIRINNSSMGISKVMVTDMRGQVLFTKSSENGFKSDLKIQAGDWVPQIYTVTLMNDKNEILEVKKFLKQ